MKYHFSHLCKIFIRYFKEFGWKLGRKMKLNYWVCKKNKSTSTLKYSCNIPFNEKQKCHVTNIYDVQEKSVILHSFVRKKYIY